MLTLRDKIKSKIEIRIILCFIISFIIIISQTIFDAYRTFLRFNDSAVQVSKNLGDLVLSQILVGDYEAIDIIINQFNNEKSGVKAKLISNKMSKKNKKLYFIKPFSWNYDYNLPSLGGKNYGYIQINFSNLITKTNFISIIEPFFVTFIFLVILLILLYPLYAKIPKKLFIDPIEKIIDFLNKEKITEDILFTNDTVELNQIFFSIKKLLLDSKEKLRIESIKDVVELISHDIRSPLSAVNAILNEKDIVEERKILLKKIFKRINDIMDNLSTVNGIKSENNELNIYPSFIPILVNSIIEEKKIEVVDLDIDFIISNKDSLFSAINPGEFKRAISNLLNNAIESVSDNRKIILSIFSNNGNVLLKIKDNGIGFHDDVLKKLGNEKITFGKKEGKGIGLFSSIHLFQLWHGNLTVENNVGSKGATVTITMPLVNPPEWFIDKIFINENISIVVIDDDVSIYEVWNNIFKENNYLNEVIYFYTLKNFENWLFEDRKNLKNYLFLIDYEIEGSEKNGLDVIEQFGLQEFSILVTNRANELKIQEKCMLHSIKLLPKSILGKIEIIRQDT